MNEIYYETQDYGDDFLMHYGVKGMKWGVRKQPSSLMTSTKKTVKKVEDYAKRAANSTYNTVKKGVALAKDIRAKRIERGKKKAIATGDYELVMKYVKHMNDNELQEAYKRIDTTQKIRDINAKQAKEAVERGVRTVETIARLGEGVVKIRTATHKMREMKEKDYHINKKIKANKEEADKNKVTAKDSINTAKTAANKAVEKAKHVNEMLWQTDQELFDQFDRAFRKKNK